MAEAHHDNYLANNYHPDSKYIIRGVIFMRKWNRTLSAFCIILFVLVSIGLPFFSFEGYSILSNTTSHLAAQGSPFAWIMDIVFVCLGIMAIITTFFTRILYLQLIGGIFGLSLVMTAFFPHAPLVASVPANLLQDQIHSVFASITGFSFTLLAIGQGVMSRGSQRVGGIVLAGIAIIISIGMMAFPSFMGLLQRLMFVSAFGWLLFYMETSS